MVDAPVKQVVLFLRWQKTAVFPQLQFITVVDIFQTIQLTIEISLSFVFGGRCPCLQVHFPVVVLRQIPWSRLSVGPFSSPLNTVADVPVVQVVLAIPVVGPAVTVHQVRRQFPVVMQKLIPVVFVTMEIPQLQYFSWWSMSLLTGCADSSLLSV